jgi:hypothetical protein
MTLTYALDRTFKWAIGAVLLLAWLAVWGY